MKKFVLLLVLFNFVFIGCSADYHAEKAQAGLQGQRVTVGTVQKDIKIGMDSSSVIASLGSPNIVTTDEKRREVWVYDKIATDVTASGGSWTILLMGQSAGAASKSQRTLTIIIKFDEDKLVRDFAYHTSRF